MQDPNEVDIASHYQLTRTTATKIETDIILFIAALNNKSPDLDEKVDKLIFLLNILMLQLIALEEICLVKIELLSKERTRFYKTEIINIYGLYFYVSKHLSAITEISIDEDFFWQMNAAIIKGYQEVGSAIHSDKRNELYFASMILFMLVKMLKDKSYLNNYHAEKGFIETYKLLKTFTSNLQTIPLKIQGLIYCFVVENDSVGHHIILRYFNLYSTPTDNYRKNISALLADKKSSEDEWYEHYALCTYLYTELLAMDNKISKSKNKDHSVLPKATYILNIENNFAVLQKLTRLWDEQQIEQLVDKLNTVFLTATVRKFVFPKIIQSIELLELLLDLLRDCLRFIKKILTHYCSKIENIDKKVHHNFLILYKKTLDQLLIITELNERLKRQSGCTAKEISEERSDIESRIKKIDDENEQQKKISESLLSSFEQPIQNIKKTKSSKKCVSRPSLDFDDLSDQCPEADIGSQPNNWTCISKEFPLNPIFAHICQIIAELRYDCFVVGGWVRDNLLNLSSHNDIDAVVLDSSFSHSSKDFLTIIQQAIQRYYPGCEIRSRCHPVLYIQHDNVIIEISALNVKPKHFKTPPSRNETLALLREDAQHRDSTDNAVFYDPKNKNLIDFFNGIDDIAQNKLVPIKPPGTSFDKDPTLIFRLLRSIVRRSSIPHESVLTYNSDIIQAMQAKGKYLGFLNKDRCYNELNRVLFRGIALATWQFLCNHNLQRHFFPIPTSEDLAFKHSIMISKSFADLDKRVQSERAFHPALTYAVLFWGVISEQLESLRKTQVALSEDLICEILTKNLTNEDLIFRLPHAVAFEVYQILCAYLKQTKQVIFDDLTVSELHAKLGNVLAKTIGITLPTPSERKTKVNYNKNQFFDKSKLESVLKDIIIEHNISHQYFNKTTKLSLNGSVSSNEEKTCLLKRIKTMLGLILGRHEILYEVVDAQTLCISTDYIDRKRAIDHLFNSIFDAIKIEYQSGIDLYPS